MLETPTFGRFYKEERFLVFEPPKPYFILVYGCIALGGLGILYGMFTSGAWWFSFVGLMVLCAGIWANFSLVRIRFDIKNRTYKRRQGPGFIPRLWQGTFDEIDAIVVLAEPAISHPGAVRYHMVMHWKPGRAPLMVLESELYFSGGHLQAGAGPMLAKAAKVSQTMRLPMFDNTHFASRCPVSVF
jgi:hypothetical protein